MRFNPKSLSRGFLVGLALLCGADCVSGAYAANAQVVGPAPGFSPAYVQTAADTAYTLAPPAGANVVCIVAEAQAIRYRPDGVAPTATVGYPLAIGVNMCIKGAIVGGTTNTLASVKIIAQTAGAIVNIVYSQQ